MAPARYRAARDSRWRPHPALFRLTDSAGRMAHAAAARGTCRPRGPQSPAGAQSHGVESQIIPRREHAHPGRSAGPRKSGCRVASAEEGSPGRSIRHQSWTGSSTHKGDGTRAFAPAPPGSPGGWGSIWAPPVNGSGSRGHGRSGRADRARLAAGGSAGRGSGDRATACEPGASPPSGRGRHVEGVPRISSPATPIGTVRTLERLRKNSA